jgi:hypothetical protein
MKVAQIIYSGLGGHGSVAFSLIAADELAQWRPLARGVAFTSLVNKGPKQPPVVV